VTITDGADDGESTVLKNPCRVLLRNCAKPTAFCIEGGIRTCIDNQRPYGLTTTPLLTNAKNAFGKPDRCSSHPQHWR
jgi:hypothetical protein